MSVRLGGMALRDGVLLQSDRFWAAAVRTPEGGVRVSSGPKPLLPGRSTLQRVPVLRGVVRLGESMAVLPAVRRRTGAPVLPQEDPRLLGATVASAVATLAVRTDRRHPLLSELAAAGISLAPVLLALRDSRLARYHGAEHKSVAAYERGISPAQADKEHERCGSNLVAPMLVTNLATNMLLRAAGKERKPLATFVAGLLSIGTAMELFSWMANHREHPLARTLRLPGVEVQRLFTTSEPSEDQLDVAHEALRELLSLEEGEPAA